MAAALILILSLMLLLVVEARATRRSVERIGLRILVNGTRGKSTTTEYLAAALRMQGRRVWGKVTGEVPSLILDDGRKSVIRRRGPARVQEQFRVIRKAARSGAEALVLECMSIDPALQELESRHFRPHIYVLTNIRDDHREELGTTREQQVAAMCRAIPAGCVVMTADRENLEAIRKESEKKRCTLVVADLPEGSVDLSGNILSENNHGGIFPENIALAAEAAARAAFNRDEVATIVRPAREAAPEVARAGSGREAAPEAIRTRFAREAAPEAIRTRYAREAALAAIGEYLSGRVAATGRQPGAGGKICFLNAFPANDPASATLCLEHWMGPGGGAGELVLLFNTRSDRPLRTDLFAGWIREKRELLRAVYLTGDHRWRAYARLKDLGPAVEVQRIGSRRIEGLAEYLVSRYGTPLRVAGIGNFKGEGDRIIKEFEG